jgi:amino acid permease
MAACAYRTTDLSSVTFQVNIFPFHHHHRHHHHHHLHHITNTIIFIIIIIIIIIIISRDISVK